MAERVSSGLVNVLAILPYLPQWQQAAIALKKEGQDRVTLWMRGGVSKILTLFWCARFYIPN